MKKIRLFLINGIILTGTSLLLRTVGVSFNVYISNKIGAEAVGVYQLVMSVYLFAITLALSGVNLSCMRIVSEELAYGLEGNVKKAVQKCLFYSLFFGILSAVVLFFTAPFISHIWLHDKVSSIPFYIIAVSLPFVSMTSCLNGYFSAVRRVVKNAGVQVIEQIIKVFLITFLINLFMPSGIDFACISLVLGSTVSEILSFILMFLLYQWDKKRYQSQVIIANNFTKRILKISLPIAITSYIKSGLSTLKQILIPLRLEKSGLSCTTSLSQYGMINGMVMPIILFPSTFINSFSNLLIPEFSYYHTRSENNKMLLALKRIFKYTLLFSIGIVGIFWCFADQISLLIYHNVEIANYVRLLSPLIIFMYFDSVIDGILKGLDKQVGVMAINILDLFSSISVIYFLLPIYGILGYIAVIFMSEILNCILSFRELKKVIEIKINYIVWIFKPIIACVFTNVFLHFFSLDAGTSVSHMILSIIIFLLVYIVMLTFLRCIKKEDIKV